MILQQFTKNHDYMMHGCEVVAYDRQKEEELDEPTDAKTIKVETCATHLEIKRKT